MNLFNKGWAFVSPWRHACVCVCVNHIWLAALVLTSALICDLMSLFPLPRAPSSQRTTERIIKRERLLLSPLETTTPEEKWFHWVIPTLTACVCLWRKQNHMIVTVFLLVEVIILHLSNRGYIGMHQNIITVHMSCTHAGCHPKEQHSSQLEQASHNFVIQWGCGAASWVTPNPVVSLTVVWFNRLPW